MVLADTASRHGVVLRSSIIFIAVLGSTVFISPSPSVAEPDPHRTVLVKLRDSTDPRHLSQSGPHRRIETTLTGAGVLRIESLTGVSRLNRPGGVSSSSGFDRIWRIETPSSGDAISLVDSLVEMGGLVEYAELDGWGAVARVVPDDPDFAAQWSLHNTGQVVEGVPGTADADVDAPEAWDVFTGGAPVLVAIVDTGVDPHPEFADRLCSGYATEGDPFDTLDTCDHGTRVAGIIAAARNDGMGIAGLADIVELLPVRVFEGCSGTESQTAAGIVWAVDHGADIVVVALSFGIGTQTLEDAVTYAVTSGALVVGSAGNTGLGDVRFPAAFEACLAVSATTSQDSLAGFSSYGDAIDLSAPGQSVLTTSCDGGYVFESGTSASAGHAAGVAALVKSYAPQLMWDELAGVLIESADDLGEVGWDPRFGAGRLSAAQALGAAPLPAIRFEHVDPLPEGIPPGEQTTVIVRILDGDQQVVSATAQLFYRIAGADFLSSPLTALGDELYEVALPIASCETLVEYYLGVMGDGGTWVYDPYDAPAELHTTVATEQEFVFDDDFEEDLGWETIIEGGEQTAGAWVRVDPNGTEAQPEYDFSPNQGRYCFVTGQHFGGSVGLTDVDYGPVRLMSPAIYIGAMDADITYARWFHSSGPGDPDELTVDVSRDGGETWVVVEIVEATVGWEQAGFRLSDFSIAGSGDLLVRFSAEDPNNDSLTEAGVDELHVRAILCAGEPALPGDSDGNGQIDLADFTVMASCMNGPEVDSGGPGCQTFDFDQDADVDLADYHVFVTLFSPLF